MYKTFLLDDESFFFSRSSPGSERVSLDGLPISPPDIHGNKHVHISKEMGSNFILFYAASDKTEATAADAIFQHRAVLGPFDYFHPPILSTPTVSSVPMVLHTRVSQRTHGGPADELWPASALTTYCPRSIPYLRDMR